MLNFVNGKKRYIIQLEIVISEMQDKNINI